MDFIDSVIRLASDELVLMFTQMAEDKVNNATDDTAPIKLPRRSEKIYGIMKQSVGIRELCTL